MAELRFFAYAEAASLSELETPVGSGQCVALIQAYLPEIKHTSAWQMGPRVSSLAAGAVPKGAVIATFWNGKYPSNKTGNHAAFYLGHDKTGITVVEQWGGTSPKQAKAIRGGKGLIRFKHVTIPEDQTGPMPDMSNIGEYYCLVLDKR